MGGDVYRRFSAAAVQAAPVFLDRDASICRLEQWAAKAKAAAADLIGFGESYIPAFPLWNMLYAPIDQHAFYRRLYDNAVEVPSPQVDIRDDGSPSTGTPADAWPSIGEAPASASNQSALGKQKHGIPQ